MEGRLVRAGPAGGLGARRRREAGREVRRLVRAFGVRGPRGVDSVGLREAADFRRDSEGLLQGRLRRQGGTASLPDRPEAVRGDGAAPQGRASAGGGEPSDRREVLQARNGG